jgi:hypothetical protein
MVELVHTIIQRIARYLEKVGLVERDVENSSLNLPLDAKGKPDGQFIALARSLRQLSHRDGSSTRAKSVYLTNASGQ